MNNDIQQGSRLPSVPLVCATVAMVFVAILLAALGYLPIINALLLLPFIVGLYGLTAIPDSRRVSLAAVLIPTFLIGLFMAIFRPAGFDYPLVWNPGPLYEGGSPFALNVNLSKAIGGYLVVIWLSLGVYSYRSALFGRQRFTMELPFVLAGVCSVLLVAYVFFGVGWAPKFPDGILYFALVNLLVTVLSEEAFFRLLLQRQIERFFRRKQIGVYVGIAAASVLFALAHSGATGMAFFLFLFAGFVYAAVYARTRSLLASITTHFGINIAHFTLLEYPL